MINPRLNLYSVPPTDLSMASRRYVKIAPFNTGINPVDFQIDPQEDFIDLNDNLIELEIVLKKNDDTNLAAGDRILPVNNLAHLLFKQIIVRLNGTLISPQTDPYHHKAFIEQILNNDRADGENLLPPQGWFNSLNVPDTADEALTANQYDPTHDDHKALPEETRTAILGRVLGGKKVTLRFKPFLEVIHLSKLLIPGVQIQMQIYFNNHSMWSVVYAGVNTLRLTEGNVNLRLFLAQVRVTPSIYRELVDDMKTGIVSYKQSVRGEEYPYESLELKHDDTRKDLRGYHGFLHAMVRASDWGQGKKCTLFVFDNTANGCLNSSVLNPKQSGELRLVITFGADPGSNLVILIYGEFENLMEADRNKTITYDVYQP